MILYSTEYRAYNEAKLQTPALCEESSGSFLTKLPDPYFTYNKQ